MANDFEQFKIAATAEDAGPVEAPTDWDQFKVTEKPEVSKLESFVQGARQGATFGFGPELSAGVEKGIGAFMSFFDPSIAELYGGKSVNDLALEHEEDVARAREANPGTFLAGDIVGATVATAPVTALNVAKTGKVVEAAQKAGKAAKMASKAALPATMGAQGAVEAGVRTLGEGGTVEDAVEAAKLGTAFGAGGTMVGTAAAKTTKYIANKIKAGAKGLQSLSEDLAVKAIGFDSPTLRRLRTKSSVFGRAKAIGRKMIDLDVANKPIRARTYHKRVSDLMDDTGKGLKKLYNKADDVAEQGVFNPNEIRSQVKAFMQQSDKFPEEKAIQAVDDELGDLLASWDPNAKMGYADLWDLIKKIDKKTRVWERASDPIFASRAGQMDTASKFLRGELLRNLKGVSDELAEEIAATSALYGQLSYTEEALSNKLVKEFGRNKSLPRTGLFETAVDYTVGSQPVRGTTVAITGGTGKLMSNLSKMGKYAPMLEKAFRQGGQSLASIHHVMMRQDPKYREKYNEVMLAANEREQR